MDTTTTPQAVLDRLSALGDENRLRLLALLGHNEFTVGDLTAALQLPQSTVSRHLKVLADDGWLRWRADGTSRHYRVASSLDEGAAALWEVVRRMISGASWLTDDEERARSVLSARKARAQAFFSEAAERWDSLRSELFGARPEVQPLFGLLHPEWVVGDLGSGTGAFTEMLAPFVRSVVAVDRSPEMLEAARDRLAEHRNVEFHEGELEALPLASGSLDVAVLLLVLHYVVEPRRALEETARVLKPGGKLIVVDMREHSREEYRDTMGHLWTGFSETQMREWSEAAGLGMYRHVGLAPAAGTSGPLLFVGTGHKEVTTHP